MATPQQLTELAQKMHEERAAVIATVLTMSEEQAALANRDKDGEDGWSAKEILAHLASMDRSYRATVRETLGLEAEDSDQSAGHYLDTANETPLLDLTQRMERERAATMEFLASLHPEDFDRTATSGNFRDMTVLQWVRSYYRHDRQHAAQIEGRESDYRPNFVGGEPDQRRRKSTVG